MTRPSQQFHDFVHALNVYEEQLRVGEGLINKGSEIIRQARQGYNMLKDRADRIAREEGICAKELCQNRQFDKEDVHKTEHGEYP